MKLDQVGAFATSLPGVTVGTRWNNRTWMIQERGFVWDRPLGKRDLERYGDTPPPRGDIVGIIVENLDAKDAILSMSLPGVFTIEHFNNYPAVLVELRLARVTDVKKLVRAAYALAAAAPAKRKRAPKAKAKAKARRV